MDRDIQSIQLCDTLLLHYLLESPQALGNVRSLISKIIGSDHGVPTVLFQADQTVAQGHVSHVADVEGFMGIGLRVLNHNVMLVCFR